jgi:hypothetical protein
MNTYALEKYAEDRLAERRAEAARYALARAAGAVDARPPARATRGGNR